MEYKWYGHFKEDDSYVIDNPDTPRHWYNYMFNDSYISFASQVGFGEGFAQDDMGRRIALVMNRNIFIAEQEYWSAMGLPINYGYTDYSCTHETGSTDIALSYNGIKSNVRMFVPNEGNNEIWSITLTNESDKTRNLKLISYAKTDIDDAYKPQGYNVARADVNEKANAAVGFFYKAFNTQRNIPMWGYMASSEKISGYDTRKNAFIGTYGDDMRPKALEEGLSCTNSDCFVEKICLAVQNDITLSPGQSKTIHITVGLAFEEQDIKAMDKKEVDSNFLAMKEKYERRLGNVRINTPWKSFDSLINNWMNYATDMGSRWARVRHNGYRDMSSDTGCLSVINAPLAFDRIKRILTYQYDNGYAPRTFIDGELKDRKFADNTVWLTFAVYNIIKELGDPKKLLEEVEFNNGTSASIYEHIKRSVDFLWNFTGLYGLVRIWGGDWNDCINYAGLEEKGVSVWLSIAWCMAAKQLAELSGLLGYTEQEALYMERYNIMKQRIDEYGWDGSYYIYARTDDDILMGSHTCEEGQIFLNPQIWAVFANLDKDDRHILAMEQAEEKLQSDMGILLSYPAYSRQYDYIGSMGEKPAGVQDNGGVYLHPAAWKLAADAMLKKNWAVEENLRKMLPFDHTYYPTQGEPYCMYNCYYLEQHGYRAGTPGQSWRTGTNGWLLKSTIMHIFGLQAEIEGLKLEPCLPESWRTCSITKVFRGCTYNISYVQDAQGACNNIKSIKVNGELVQYKNNIIPAQKDAVLNIEVVLD